MKNRLLIILILIVLFCSNCSKNNDKPEEKGKDMSGITLHESQQGKAADSIRNFQKEKELKELIGKMTSAVDKLPEVVKQGVVKYPQEDAKAGIQGTIYLKLVIDKKGIVKKAEVIKREDGSENLEKAALDAAYKTIYKPAQKDGKPVECSVVIPYKFKLR